MTIFQSLLLGIIQGITEFLPISSSAHLVLFPYLLGWQLNEQFVFPFNVLVQIGTLVAVISYFRDDLLIIGKAMLNGIMVGKPFEEIPARTGYLTLLATFPAGLIGLALKEHISTAFSSPRITSLFLIGTAALLVISETIGKRNKELGAINYKDALWIGLFQALSVFPGISRSGSTITGGMTRHLDRKTAGQFAFIMAIPIMLAAGLLEVIDLIYLEGLNEFLPILLVGFSTAAVSGFFTIRWLLKFISQHSLLPFAVYCLLLGAGSFILTLTNPQISFTDSQTAKENKVYMVSYEPDLEWITPIMTSCQDNASDMQIVFQQQSWRQDIYTDTDLFLMYGEKKMMSKFAFLIGSDEVVPAANLDLSIQNLPDQGLRDIFLGRQSSWNEVYETCPTCFKNALSTDDRPIHIYSFSNQSAVFQTFSDYYLQASPSGANIKIAPTSQIMKELIVMDKNAIGYLPRSWIDDSLTDLSGTIEPERISKISIIATGQQAPDGTNRIWLACVQASLETR